MPTSLDSSKASATPNSSAPESSFQPTPIDLVVFLDTLESEVRRFDFPTSTSVLNTLSDSVRTSQALVRLLNTPLNDEIRASAALIRLLLAPHLSTICIGVNCVCCDQPSTKALPFSVPTKSIFDQLAAFPDEKPMIQLNAVPVCSGTGECAGLAKKAYWDLQVQMVEEAIDAPEMNCYKCGGRTGLSRCVGCKVPR